MYGYPLPREIQSSATTSPTKSPTTSYYNCGRSNLILEVVLFLYTALHLLVMTFAVSLIRHHFNSGQNQEELAKAAEIAILCVAGAITSMLAILGLWLRQRPLFVPLVVYLFVTIILDAISVFYYVVAVQKAEPDYPLVSPISIVDHKMDYMLPKLIAKLVISIWLVQKLVTMYKIEDSMKEESVSPSIKVGKYSKFKNCEL